MDDNSVHFALNENDFIIKAQKGDKSSLTAILTEYSQTVRKITLGYNSKSLDRDDLAQEGMLGLLNAIMTYNTDSGASFRTYAYTCISNKIKSALKSHCNTIENAVVDVPVEDIDITVYDTPELQVIEKEQYNDLLLSVYSVLTANEISVLRLYLNGNTYKEIASILGKNEKSVDNALQRIKRKLTSVQ